MARHQQRLCFLFMRGVMVHKNNNGNDRRVMRAFFVCVASNLAGRLVRMCVIKDLKGLGMQVG
jgi:hypothetical protein